MKIKVSKNIHSSEKSLEEFKLTEFSTELDIFVPDLSLSCNECEDAENEKAGADSVLSFLIKFKADKLNDPRKIEDGGVGGMVLPEGSTYNYKKEAGNPSFFKSVKENHYNLHLTAQSLDQLCKDLHNYAQKRPSFTPDAIEKYLVSNYESMEWKQLLSHPKKKTWKSYVKESLKAEFRKTHCDFKKDDLKSALAMDPETIKERIKKLNEYDCFTGAEKNEIRQAFGQNFI